MSTPGAWKKFFDSHDDAMNRGNGKFDPNKNKFSVCSKLSGGMSIASTNTFILAAQNKGYMGERDATAEGVENEFKFMFGQGKGARVDEVSIKSPTTNMPEVTTKASLTGVIPGAKFNCKAVHTGLATNQGFKKVEFSGNYKAGPINASGKFDVLGYGGGFDAMFNLGMGAVLGAELTTKKSALTGFNCGATYAVGNTTCWVKSCNAKNKEGGWDATQEIKALTACSGNITGAFNCNLSKGFSVADVAFGSIYNIDSDSNFNARLDLGDITKIAQGLNPATEVAYTNKLYPNLSVTGSAALSFNDPLRPKIGFSASIA